MKIAILGGGFTGLSAALKLLSKGHEVIIFEKENNLGGLAVGFKNPKWNWTLEKGYHHWFTNDSAILKLAKYVGQEIVVKRPLTDVFIDNKTFHFDSAISLLKFPKLTLLNRVRLGLSLLYLKSVNNYKKFENQKAYEWIKKWMGQKSLSLIWDPLLTGKFGEYKNDIALTWFWARIKKRTPSLAYPMGGFKVFADRIGEEIKKLGGKILLDTTVTLIKKSPKKVQILANGKKFEFDKVIVTLPSPIFTKITNGLPEGYIKKINSIPHLFAQVLILILKKPFMDKTYWLNILEKDFPFLVLAEHTNFMDPKDYGGQHILYIGNYLPIDHLYLKISKIKLLKIFKPYLKKINSKFTILDSLLFIAPFAQPVVTVDYPKLIPTFKTPLKNIYLANLDMVYPWDRGTNYAVELGEQVAYIVQKD